MVRQGPNGGDAGPKTTGYSPLARLRAADCYILAHESAAAAEQLLAERWDADAWGPFPRRPGEFIKRSAAKLRGAGNLFDAPRPGRAPKLSDAQAAEAAELFDAGFTLVGRLGRGRPLVEERHGYASMGEALRFCEPLRAIQEAAGVTAATLWARVKPKLKRRRRVARKSALLAAQAKAEARRGREKDGDDSADEDYRFPAGRKALEALPPRRKRSRPRAAVLAARARKRAEKKAELWARWSVSDAWLRHF